MAACQVALIGAVAVGLVESVGAAVVTSRHFGDAGWPVGLIAASAGKSIVTYGLVLLPVLLVAGLAYRLVHHRRFDARPEPLLVVVMLVVVGTVAVPVDLRLIYRDTPLMLVGCGVLVAAAATCAYLGLRRLIRRGRSRTVRRLFNRLAGVTLFIAIGCGAMFVRSPLFDPAAYRVGVSVVAHPQPDHPNVLWIVMDTVRADHLSLYGYPRPTTPFLERFARQSVVFDRAMSSGIWTVPSHASMFTGRSIRAHGMDLHNLWLDDEHVTLAERLQRAGYATAIFSNNPWVSPFSNLTQGFETCVSLHYLPRLTRSSIEYLVETRGWSPPLPWLDNDYGGAITNSMVGDWLDQQARYDEPFFLFVNYMDAHLPYRVPASYRRMFMDPDQVARSYALRWRAYGHITRVMSERFNVEGPGFMEPADIEILKRQYDAAIRYEDDRVGELVDMFASRGLLDNTVVVIASDHGEYLDTHGMWGHRYLAYDDVTHVALLIREPGRRTGRRVASAVSLCDLYATIERLTLGGNAPDHAQGHDLLTAVRGDSGQDMVISEYGGPTPSNLKVGHNVGVKTGDHRDEPQIAATSQHYKYIASADHTRELYHLSRDPTEHDNLIDAQPAVARRFADYVARWLDRVPQYVPHDPESAANMDAGVIESLRDIGYAGDGD